MRVSSSTFPSLMGTLKSTRMKTRRPARWRSLIESLDIFDIEEFLYFVLSTSCFVLDPEGTRWKQRIALPIRTKYQAQSTKHYKALDQRNRTRELPTTLCLRCTL